MGTPAVADDSALLERALYFNFLGHDVDPKVMRDGVGAETYEKLVRIKTKYDPTNFFRMNQNIAPTQAETRKT